MDNSNGTADDYFGGLFENRISKILITAFSFFGTLILMGAISGIIWFERAGNKDFRTLINRLVSCFCFSALQWFVFVQLVDTYRYLYWIKMVSFILLILMTIWSIT